MKEILDDHLIDQKIKRKGFGFYFTLVLLIIGSILSSLLSWEDVETIMGTGPVMSFIGIVHFVYARKAKARVNISLGLLPLLISIIWFILINLFSLSPNDVSFTVPASLTGATFLITLIGIVVLQKRKKETRG